MAALVHTVEHVPFWTPQPGPQTALITCPISEIIYGGARGGGKTSGMLGYVGLHCITYGLAGRAIIFRRTLGELEEVERQAFEMYPKAGAVYSVSRRVWTFPTGGTVRLRYLEKTADASRYQGHQYSLVVFEEMTQWPDSEGIDMLRGTVRGIEANVDRKFIGTCNPGGPGHQWVKERYNLPDSAYQPFHTAIGDTTAEVVFIPAKLSDNPLLLKADPKYVERLRTAGPSWLVKAWLAGDWNIVPGAFLEGFWDPERHVVKQPFRIPAEWTRWRAMDWGVAKPYSIGWYAMDRNNIIYRYRESYGYGGKANTGSKQTAEQVATQVLGLEANDIAAGAKFNHNPADNEIWTRRGLEITVADAFDAKHVYWTPALKGPGSRINGAHEVITRLANDSFRVFPTCKHFLRTVPSLVPDANNLEDVDTDQEDHTWDELRYSLVSRQSKPKQLTARPRAEHNTFNTVTNPRKLSPFERLIAQAEARRHRQ